MKTKVSKVKPIRAYALLIKGLISYDLTYKNKWQAENGKAA